MNQTLILLLIASILVLSSSAHSFALSEDAAESEDEKSTPGADGQNQGGIAAKQPVQEDILQNRDRLRIDPFETPSRNNNKPLLRGGVCKMVPFDWNGTWHGKIQLDLLKGDKSQTALRGNAVDIRLQLETAKTDSTVFNLQVHKLHGTVSSKDSEPDIHYWHSGTADHLDIRNGASMVTNGSLVVGGKPGTTSTVSISGGAHMVIGGLHNSSGKASSRIANKTGTGGSTKGNGSFGDNYGNGGIYTTGPTQYEGRYFKSDDRLATKEGLIQADRIDVGHSTVMTGGQPVRSLGDKQTGFVLSQLAGGGIYLSPAQIADATNSEPVQLMTPQTQTRIVKLAPGVFEINTVGTLMGAHGPAGTQYITMKLTAEPRARMLVHMTIENYDLKSKLLNSFAADGNIYR